MPDGGWTTNGLDVTTSYGVHFDPFDPQHMFISYTDIGLFASDNGGASWYSATRSGVPGSWVNTTYWMEFDPNTRGRMWAVMSGVHDLPRPKMWRSRSPETYDGGVVRSDDGGRTWRVQNVGMPQTAATHILRDPGGTLYVTGFGRGVFKSTDGGATWGGVLTQDQHVYDVTIDPREPSVVYGAGFEAAAWRSADRGLTWRRIPGFDFKWAHRVIVDPRDPGRIFITTFGGSVWYGKAE